MKYRGRGEGPWISLYVIFLDEYYFLDERGKWMLIWLGLLETRKFIG
jgi:hypothetical protein